MRIDFEIPDELVEKKVLWLFAGNVHIAIKRHDNEKWVVKEGLCSCCGECCKESHISNLGLPIKDGYCLHLIDHPTEEGKKWCGLKGNRPFLCCVGSARFTPECTVTWKRE